MILGATSTVVHLNVQLLTEIASVFLPLLVGVVTKEVASSSLKAIVLAVLSVVNGLVSTWIQQGGNFDWVVALNQVILSFVVATAAHFGFMKPTGIADNVQSATSNFGVGGGNVQAAGTIDNQMNPNG